MKKLVTVIFLTLLSCATVEDTARHDSTVRSLKEFFERCQSDLEKAARVIVDNDLIKNLSHLQNMNFGGKKYYLLERENITDMIQSVTEGVYADFILINKEGRVIYTKKNDEIFGKNVKTSLQNTVLHWSYNNREIFPYIGDVSKLSTDDSTYYVTVSSKVKGGNTFPGIFILQVDIAKIEELLDKKTLVCGGDGLYKIITDRLKINTSCEDFTRINPEAKSGPGGSHFFTGPGGARMRYQIFTYSNLRWIIITEP